MQLLINCIGHDIKEKEGSGSNVEGQNIDLYEKRLKRTTGRVINMEEEDHQGQSNSSPIEIDLPESFTDKIINIIQNKSQESPAEFVEDASELESEEYKPAPPPKNNCKKSGKKIEDPYYSKPKKPKGRPRKEQNLVNEQTSQSYMNQEAAFSPRSKAVPKKATTNGISPQVVRDYHTLKQYIEQFLTVMLTKMEENTNKKFKEQEKRIEGCEARIEEVENIELEAKRKDSKWEQEYRYPEAQQERNKRNSYIKSWVKLQYIEKIEKGQMTIKQVCKQLKLKEGVVQSWIANRQKLRQKAQKKPARRLQRDQIDSDCLDID